MALLGQCPPQRGENLTKSDTKHKHRVSIFLSADNFIHQVNHCLINKCSENNSNIHWIVSYPECRVICDLKNRRGDMRYFGSEIVVLKYHERCLKTLVEWIFAFLVVVLISKGEISCQSQTSQFKNCSVSIQILIEKCSPMNCDYNLTTNNDKGAPFLYELTCYDWH